MRSKTYTNNAARAEYKDRTPTKTDQSQAKDTDINVIVGRYGIAGTAPGAKGQPITGDFSELPTDLRGMIEKARELEALRQDLPPEYQHMTTEELLNTSPTKLLEITKNAGTIKERRDKLPERYKRMSDQDILGLTTQEYEHMLAPVPTNTPTPAPAPGEQK